MSDLLFLRCGRESRAGDVLCREGERGEERPLAEFLEMPRRFEA